MIVGALKKGGKVLGIDLRNFAGVLRSEDAKLRLGAEMAQRARTKGVAGIFHSDELPAYGIDSKYVEELRKDMSLGENDAFILCADEAIKATHALQAAVQRANDALIGVPEETRDPQPDGSSTYSRPLPGADRMYPETDVPPNSLFPKDRLSRISSDLPELPEERISRMCHEYGVHEQQARQLVREGWDDIFEDVSASKELAAIAARTFCSTFSELEHEGVKISTISEGSVRALFSALEHGKFAKEALPDILRQISEGKDVEEAIKALGIKVLSTDDASAIVSRIVKEREAFIKEKGLEAMGPLMAPVMTELRGKLDGKTASDLLRKKIEDLLRKG